VVIITSIKTLLVDPSRCTGCRTCEMACSLYHEGKCSPVLSRMRIIKYEALGKSYPSVCCQCSKPQCSKPQCSSVCPSGAIKPDEMTGALTVDEDLCTGCRTCLVACPQIGFHPQKKVAFKCDLCGGEPQCVRFCTSGAISFSGVDEFQMSRRRAAADRAVQAVQV
jgi:anaerobic carbon-monoxide dehydrogenase iron sulfur subunit